MVRGWKADEVVRALVLEETAKRESQKATDQRLASLRSSPKKAAGGKVSDESVLSLEEDSVPSKVPSVESVMDFDVVKRLGTERSGVTLDPEEVDTEFANLSDDEEGVGQTEDEDVVVIED